MTTERTLAGRARSVLSDALDVALTAAILLVTAYLGVVAHEMPLLIVSGGALAIGVPAALGVYRAETRTVVRQNTVMAGLQTTVFVVSAIASATSPPGILATVATFGGFVTLGVAGGAFYGIAFGDEQVPYLSHYIETGAWSA